MSIKPPALDFSHELSCEVVDQAALGGVRVHFDALAPEAADRSRDLFDRLIDRGAEVTYTLPGRWRRSVSDAAWVAERKIVARVVKGQWADPDNPARDPRFGYLEVIDALAGRACACRRRQPRHATRGRGRRAAERGEDFLRTRTSAWAADATVAGPGRCIVSGRSSVRALRRNVSSLRHLAGSKKSAGVVVVVARPGCLAGADSRLAP